MLNNVSFGQYYPVSSPVHRMDARVKLLLTILYIVTIFVVQTYSGYIATLLVLLATIVIARIPLKTVLK
jgi:energy-coupling factor transport system permease protein